MASLNQPSPEDRSWQIKSPRPWSGREVCSAPVGCLTGYGRQREVGRFSTGVFCSPFCTQNCSQASVPLSRHPRHLHMSLIAFPTLCCNGLFASYLPDYCELLKGRDWDALTLVPQCLAQSGSLVHLSWVDGQKDE